MDTDQSSLAKPEGWRLLRLLSRKRKYAEYPYGSSISPEMVEAASGDEVYQLLGVKPTAETESAYARVFDGLPVTVRKAKRR